MSEYDLIGMCRRCRENSAACICRRTPKEKTVSEKQTMTLNLSAREMAVVEELAGELDLSKTAVLRQALKLYQLVHMNAKDGRHMMFTGEPPMMLTVLTPSSMTGGVHGSGGLTEPSEWPAPSSRDWKGAPDSRFGTNSRPLNEVAKIWATPSVADVTGGRQARSGERSNELLLNGQSRALTESLCSRPGPPTSTDGEAFSTSGRRLNPLFVEWLMGWPPGWTSFACSATGLSLWRRRMRSALSRQGSPEEAPAQLTLFG